MKILIIAPHPDDEVLGCGGTIAKHVKGEDEVYLCIVTKAYTPDWSEDFLKKRSEEIKKANEILGIKKTYLLDFPTIKLDTIPQKELVDSITNIVGEVKPDVMYIPHKGDLNKDHRLVFEATLVVARPINNNLMKILSYETLSETEWGKPIVPFVPNVYVDIASTVEKKIEAMKSYKSELRKLPHPRSEESIRTLARIRGLESGLDFAEAFTLIREIEK